MKWLFLVHRVQTRRSRDRVKVWRLTRKIGALLYRNSVYVLPYSKERLEDFHWLCQQIRDTGGDASVFFSEARDSREDASLVKLFRDSRAEDYAGIRKAAARCASRLRRAETERRLTAQSLRTLGREVNQLSEQCAAVERIDFFPRHDGRSPRTVIDELARELREASPHAPATPLRRLDPSEFQGKTWATRSHIHIDRLCSAWLIKRFIDPKAKFVFAPEGSLPANAISFDSFGAKFSHHGEDCTFETLLKTFALKGGALSAIGEIVHDIDVKDAKYGRPEAAGVDAVVRALSAWLADDAKTLEVGSIILDALYAAVERRTRR